MERGRRDHLDDFVERTDGRLLTQVSFAWSPDRGRTWRPLLVSGAFDLHAAALSADGDFVGDYQGLAGTARGFELLFVLAEPLAFDGPTDVDAATVTPRGS